jgi:hypothetical protein
VSNTSAVQPMTFPQFCVSVQPGNSFYAIIDDRVRTCELTAIQVSRITNKKCGIWFTYRRMVFFKRNTYRHKSSFDRATFKSFPSKRDAKAHRAEANRDDDRLRNGINHMTHPGMI